LAKESNKDSDIILILEQNKEEFMSRIKKLNEVLASFTFSKTFLGEGDCTCILEEMDNVTMYETFMINNRFFSHIISIFHKCILKGNDLQELKEVMARKGKLFSQLFKKILEDQGLPSSFKASYELTPELRSTTVDFCLKFGKTMVIDNIRSGRNINANFGEQSFVEFKNQLEGRSVRFDDSIMNRSSVGKFRSVMSIRDSYFRSLYEN
jgi:hypothetical protein